MKFVVGLALVVVATSASSTISATTSTLASSESSASSGIDPGCPRIICAAIMSWEECAMGLPERCRPKMKDYDTWEENKHGSSACSDICPDIYLPVCGSDGVKYSNPCKLIAAACKNPGLHIVQSGNDMC